MFSPYHTAVLLKEVEKFLAVKPDGKYIDATVGGGGHALAILQSKGQLLGIDCDPEAIKAAREYLSSACPPRPCKLNVASTSWRLVRGNFRNLKAIAEGNGFAKVEGILFDLGVSGYQLETAGRGFSFKSGGPLDMRMDPDLGVTAGDLINGLSKGELEELFRKFAQEEAAGRIAQVIVQERAQEPIRTADRLARIVAAVKGGRRRHGRHPATLVFQALRIAVNDELNNLRLALPQAIDLLKPGGRLVVISFHSGEDRIVKWFLKEKKKERKVKILTAKVVRPSEEEIKKNPRSRSAKLRAAVRTET